LDQPAVVRIVNRIHYAFENTYARVITILLAHYGVVKSIIESCSVTIIDCFYLVVHITS